MNSIAVRLGKHLRISSQSHAGVLRRGTLWYSTSLSENQAYQPSHDNDGPNNEELDDEIDDFLGGKPELQLQGVDPKRGWGFRGVHKAIICGKVGQAPVQKILRNGKNVTIFTVGTGGMYDQRIVGAKDLPKPAQGPMQYNNFLKTLQFMLRVTLKLEFTMIALMVKLKAFQRYVFVAMGKFASSRVERALIKPPCMS